jgi:hypothetical protein
MGVVRYILWFARRKAALDKQIATTQKRVSVTISTGISLELDRPLHHGLPDREALEAALNVCGICRQSETLDEMARCWATRL